jgi:hypothetical protein
MYMTILVPDYFNLRRTYSEKALQDLINDQIEEETKKIHLFYTLLIVYFLMGYLFLIFFI